MVSLGVTAAMIPHPDMIINFSGCSDDQEGG
jgi:hypothetical protein